MKSFAQGSSQQHTDLGKNFKIAVGELPYVRIIPYTVGMFRDFTLAERIIHSGETGIPDWIVFGCGWYLFFDSKTGKAKLSPEQKDFKKLMDDLNGIETVYVLHTVEEGINIIKQAHKYYSKRNL